MDTGQRSTAGRWVGVGRDGDADATTAAARAVAGATLGRTPALVVLFVTPGLSMVEAARAAQDALPDGVPVVGCSTSGEIAARWAGSGHVVAVALGGDGLTVRTSVGHLVDGARAAGQEAARCLEGVDRPHQVLLLLSDGLAGSRADIVRGAYSVAGAAVPLVGGCAGDEMSLQGTTQLCGGEVLSGAVVGVAIGSEAPIAVGVGHGWERLGEPMVVTESTGDRILTLDDRPALEVFLEAAGAPPEAFTDPRVFKALTLGHPLGLPRPGGDEVRAIMGADVVERSLVCGDVPQGTVLSLMAGASDTILTGTRTAAEHVLAGLDGAAPAGVIAFDCVARRAVLGVEGMRQEMDVLADALGDVPLGGFYTYGEFARVAGSRGVHNATLVLLAFA